MKSQARSIFHLVLLFIFVVSQQVVQPVSAAETMLPDGAGNSAPSAGAMPGPLPAAGGAEIGSADNFQSARSAMEIAAELNLLSYTLPSYPVYSQQNGLSIEPLVAYNLVVDSNVLSPASYGPSAATFGARYCNMGTSNLTNVWAYIGNYDSDYNGTLGDAAAGSFPRRSETGPAYDPAAFASSYGPATTNPLVGSTSTDYGVTNAPFALKLASGSVSTAVDGSRYIGTLTPGECKTQYWLVTYPRKASNDGGASWKDVTGGIKPEDDLWLPYFFWGTSTLGGATNTSYRWNVVTMRNEISAMANKIWPNGDNKVPDQYLHAIAQLVGWDTLTPTGTSTVYPGDTVVSQGIWYDLGNVGHGFDNNGDFTPDRNAWLQPIGDAGSYDPGCFRLVRTYGLIIVKLNDGTEQLIPFVDQLYFENIPDNNTGVVGLVFYEYAALDGVCTAGLTPYQEVASGFDNEKFNADFGAGIPPLQSQESNMTLDKTGPNTVSRTETINYSLTFTLPDIDTGNTATLVIGQPAYGMPLTYSDVVPVGLQYVANSASTTVDMSANYPAGDIPVQLWHSKDGGLSWLMGDPGNYTSTSTSNQLILQWRLQSGVESPASGAPYTGTVAFQAVVPGTYAPVIVENEACLKIGSGPGFTCDEYPTIVKGNNWLGGLTWKDDGASGGVAVNALRDGGEEIIGRVSVNLYYDTDNDGDGDIAFGSVETLPYPVIDGYLDYDRDGVTAGDTGDTGTVAGISVVNGRLDLDGAAGVTAADDGTFLGYAVIDGYLDIDRDDVVSGDATDDLAQGNYRFSALPDGAFVVTVDYADSDIPSGYTPTTRTTRTASLSVATPSVTGLDFGFGPVLSIDKFITPTTYAEGDTLTYTIKVTNLLSGTSSGGSTCSYYVWANTVYPTTWAGAPDGGGPVNSQWQQTSFAMGGPDDRYAYSVMTDNTDTLGLSGYNLGDMGGTITSVQYAVSLNERTNLSPTDRFIVNVFYNDTQEESVEYYGDGSWRVDGVLQTPATAYLTGPTGSKYLLVRTLDAAKITNRVAPNNVWRWTDFLSNLMELQVEANKGQNNGDINLDAAGFIITTNQACGGASSILNPVPLTDSFDNTYLRYLSSSPSISGQSTAGATTTLVWNNVGPLAPGETNLIDVQFQALTAVNPTTNTATTANAKFVDGRPANTPVTDTANVTITSVGSISGKIWHNADGDGWVGTTGYETGEIGIGDVNVQLYACQVAGTNFRYPVGTNDRGDTCAMVGGTWNLMQTLTTGPSGDYLFNNLVPGFYYVSVDTASLPANALTAGERDTATGDQDGTPSGNTGNGIWGSSTNPLTNATGGLEFFNHLESGEHITNVNFGYNGFTPAIYGTVWQDFDGNGVRNLVDDTGIGGVAVTLINCGVDLNCATAGDNSIVGTQVTMSSGFYMFENLAIGRRYQTAVNTATLPAGSWTNTDEDAPPGSSGVATQGTGGDGVLITATMAAGNLLGGFDFGYHQSGTANIGDTLWYDWNGDADWDTASEETISNVNVRLYKDNDGDGIIDSNDALLATTATLGYTVINGYIDLDRDGAAAGETGDDGSTEGFTVIDGRLDISGNGTIGSEDDGSYLALTVIDGYLDLDGDGIVDGDAEDDLGVGQYRFTNFPAGNYIVKVDQTDSNFPASLVPTYDADEGSQGNLCAICDSLSTVTLTPSDADQDFGYQPTGSGRIGDTVFRDVNGNGIQDGTGENGLAGVVVELQVDWNGDGNYVTLRTTTTDQSGNYLFSNLPAGSFRVSVNVSSNAAAIPDDSFGNDYFPSNGTTAGTAVYMDKTLPTSTSSDLTADFGFAPPASIGDTVYQDINRNGTQDLNEPGMNGVTVTLYRFTDSNGNGRYDPSESGTLVSTGQAAVTATVGGIAGSYQFDGLRPGYYVVQPTPPVGSVLTADPNTDGFSCDDLSEPAGAGEPSASLCDNRDGMRLYNGTNYTGADFGYFLSGTFGDRLWIDSDGDGRVDTGERGIPNITVTASTTVPVGATVIVAGSTYTAGQTITLTTTTDINGNYSFQNISASTTITWTVTVDTADTDFPSGLVNTSDPDDPDGDNTPAHNSSTIVTMNTSGAITGVGALADGDDDGDASDPLYLDVDFGYRYLGATTITGTVCLETSVDGVCGDGTADTSGVGTGETAYDNITVFLYRLNDTNGNGRVDAGETTALVSSTSTTAAGDFSFNNVVDGVYYIIAIGAPQDGLDLTSSQTSVNAVGDASTTSYVETTAFDGTTLSAYQVVNTAGDTSVTDRDFAFKLSGNYDFGDLPGTYSTLLAGTPDGARHLVPAAPSLYFGESGATQASLVDTDGQPSTDASGDGSDENGVFIPTDATSGAENADGWTDGVGVVQFDIVGSGWLVGWMDFDGDGRFTDSNEMIISRSVSSGQDQNLAISTPTTAISGTYVYARFRLFPSKPSIPNLAFSGEASGGEVEDYRFPVNGGVVTPVTLAYFRAQRHGSAVNFEWTTATESGNIGFNLYVETPDGDLLRINAEMILSKSIDSLDHQDYTYSLDAGGEIFYLEEFGVLGETRLHGPFQLGEKYGGEADEEKIDLTAVNAEHEQKFVQQQESAKKQLRVPPAALQSAASTPFTVAELQLQNTLNLKVNKTGIYRVTYEMLKASGLDLAGVPTSKITVTNRGQVVPILVEAQGKGATLGKFGPGDYFEFYGEALDTIYTDTNIYTIQISKSAAPRISSNQAAPSRATTAPVSFQETLAVNNQKAYANYALGDDPWYDTSMIATTRKTWKFTFQINGLVDVSTSQPLELVIWGSNDWPARDPDHHILVSVNGVSVAEDRFDGMQERTIRTTLPAGTLHEGANTLELTLPADTGATYDAINLDKFIVGYSRSFQAQDGRLNFSATGKVFTVTNLPSGSIVVYRMDDKGIARLGQVKVQQTGSSFSATFAGTDKQATYLVSTVESLHAPRLEATRLTVNLNQPAQYLIIAHPDFISRLQPLIQGRQAQGLTVSVVDVNDLYAQYSYGIFDPLAIKQYIAHARKNLGTQYVLLVGGDTYDYRNYLGKNSISFIPSLYATTGPTSRFVPVDPLYADVDGNNVPDLAIGRFPVRTNAELDLLLAKTLAYAQKDYGRTAVFASDKFDGIESFKSISQNMSASLPAGWSSQQIHMDDMPVGTAQKKLIEAMNKGPAFVTYTGHSAATVWSFSRLFQTQHAETLTNAGRPFVVVQWGCFNTYYVDPVNKTLVQSFLFSGDRGAVAVLGASTRTDSASEEALGVLITPRLTAPGMTIGQAMQEAKFELAREHPELLDVILGWTLMGDPALVIQP